MAQILARAPRKGCDETATVRHKSGAAIVRRKAPKGILKSQRIRSLRRNREAQRLGAQLGTKYRRNMFDAAALAWLNGPIR
jgi:hypothetical protein